MQRRYSAAADAYAVSYSAIDLHDEAFVAEPRPIWTSGKQFSIFLVESPEQMYKAPDVLIRGVAENVRRDLDLELIIVGGGRHRPELESLGHACGLKGRIRFTGILPTGDPIRAELDRADLFILPSRTEGLPRVLIEAMARALPCLGCDVGGIPERLSAEELVPPGDVNALAVKIRELVTDRDRQARLSARNLKKAREFHLDILQSRRRAFCEAVRDATLKLLRAHPVPESMTYQHCAGNRHSTVTVICPGRLR